MLHKRQSIYMIFNRLLFRQNNFQLDLSESCLRSCIFHSYHSKLDATRGIYKTKLYSSTIINQKELA